MRFILGVIVGIALTIGAAYIRDTSIPAGPVVAAPAEPDGAELAESKLAVGQRPVVNWDVVGAIAREQTDFVRGLWNRALAK